MSPPAATTAGAVAGTADVQVLKSPNDKKEYKYLVLENGMRVLLVHDPEIDLSDRKTKKEAGGPKAEDGSDSDAEDSGSDSESGSDDDESLSDSPPGGVAGSDTSEGSMGEEEGPDGAAEHDDEEAGGARGASEAPKKKAAAALSVGVGSFSDPEDLLGCSHYLEHMLFMGSEAFPKEDEYDVFLTRHGGSSNAYTETEFTNYHFDVKPSALRGALERFSQFFVAPLCLEGALGREVHAVDNEFTGVLQSDSCRAAQLRCHTAREGHVYRKFTWGNKKSLEEDPRGRGMNVRERLMEYYHQHYSADRMSLVLLGGQPLPELESWVRELFGGVRGGLGQGPRFESLPVPFDHPPSMFLLPAVKEQHWIHVSFQLPPQHRHYLKKAEDYISHLVGHEGRGSLLSALKARGIATELVSGVSESGYDRNSNVYLFGVSMTLSEAGVADRYGLGAVELLFSYLDLLRKEEPHRWVWDEIKSIADLRFRFQEEDDAMDFVSGVAATMPLYSPEHVLVGDVIHEDFDPNLIKELLGYMTPRSPGLRIELQTKTYPTLRDSLLRDLSDPSHPLHTTPAPNPSAPPVPDRNAVLAEQKEPWFDLPYVAAPLGEGVLTWLEGRRAWGEGVSDNGGAARAAKSDLALPPRNDFIPSDFSLCCESPSAPPAPSTPPPGPGLEALAAPPTLLIDGPGLRLWHKVDYSFKTPRTACYLYIHTPEGYGHSARGAALQYLTAKLLAEATCEISYLAETAGLHCHVASEGIHGIGIKIWGFSHRLPSLCRTILEALARLPELLEGGNGSEGELMFQRVHEAAVKKFRNHNLQPTKEATWARLYLIRRVMWHSGEEGGAVESLSLSDVASFVRQLCGACHVEAMVHGNIWEEEARGLGKDLLSVLTSAHPSPSPLPASSRPEDSVAQLPAGCSHVVCMPAKNPEEKNSAIENYYQCASDDLAAPKDRAIGDLLEQIMFEPCFDELRTKQQLGYTVYCGTRLTQGAIGFAVHIVSGARPPSYLDARIEEFLSAFATRLKKIEDEEFEQHREALIHAKLSKDRGLTDESERHWYQVQRRSYAFHSRELEVSEIRRLTKSDIVAWYDSHVSPSSRTRRKASVRVVGRDAWDAAADWEDEVLASGPEPVDAAAAPLSPGRPSKKARQAAGAARGTSGAAPAAPGPRFVEPVRRLRVPDVVAFRSALPTWPLVLGEVGKPVA